MYEIEKVEFNKWVKSCNEEQLSKYDISLINLIIENFDEIVRKAAYLCEKRENCKVFVKIFAMLI